METPGYEKSRQSCQVLWEAGGKEMLRIATLSAMGLLLEIVLFAAIALLLIGIFVYQQVMPLYAAKKGRQVDARVLSCQKKTVENEDTGTVIERYEVTVDFYGINGEALVKTLQVAQSYVEGDVIRCCYLDKTGRLFPGTAREIQAGMKKGAAVFSIFFIVFMGIAAAVLWGIPRANEKPELAALAFGYAVSMILMAIGVLGIYKKVKMRQNIRSMRSVTGVLTGYTEGGGADREEDSEESSGKSYYPVYEYEWQGETRQFFSRWGKDEKEQRAIGRQVHILVNPGTGETICREDEKPGERVALVIGIIGVVIFALMLAFSFGMLAKDRGEQEKGGAASAYAALYLYDGGEQYRGRGCCDEGIYAEICGLIQQIVPDEAWAEMERREAAYYQR